MHSSVELTVVVVLGLGLAIGLAMRRLSKATALPYTIAMLLAGLGLGAASHSLVLAVPAAAPLLHPVAQASSIGPDLILLVFLPTLVFESAFVLDGHELRKNFGVVALLAVPALVASTVLTAGAMVWLTSGSWQWSLSVALVFGALISATDPVAVVAILRELGVSKRLGVLIEGESLLNDGTAIVVFGVLVEGLTQRGAELDAVAAIGRFGVVVAGGAAVGVALAFIAARFLGRLFNDPVSEISTTLLLAYAAMIIAEAYLHVSGVISVVVAGLWLSVEGRTQISPEVSHFLERFWELVGFLANTLIFFVVGLVIAKELDHAVATDLAIIIGAYLLMMLVRFALVFALRPVAGWLGDRGAPSIADAVVVSWGGLRGAVSLALALLVARHPDVDPVVGAQVLIVTAGVVFLTIVINGSTISRLLGLLGLDRVPLTKKLALLRADEEVLRGTIHKTEKLRGRAELPALRWREPLSELEQRVENVADEAAQRRAELAQASPSERTTDTWRRAITLERRAYWELFNAGTLGAEAVRLLDARTERHLDSVERGELELEAPRPGRWKTRIGRIFGRDREGFERLALLYDLHRAEHVAAGRVLAHSAILRDSPSDVASSIRNRYRQLLRQGQARIEEMRENLPELVDAIETRLAHRIRLNLERDAIEDQVRNGLLGRQDAERRLMAVEERMHKLHRSPPRGAIVETADCVADAPLFAALDEKARAQLAMATEERVVLAGEDLVVQGEVGSDAFVIARGAAEVHISVDGESVLVDVLGRGDVVGEMSLLTGARRAATVRAASSLTVGRVDREALMALFAADTTLERRVWDGVFRRALANELRRIGGFDLDPDTLAAWMATGRKLHLRSGESVEPSLVERWLFVVAGSVRVSAGGRERLSPFVGPQIGLLPKDPTRVVLAQTDVRLALLPAFTHLDIDAELPPASRL